MAAGTRAKATINDVELDFSGLFSAGKQADATQTGAIAKAPDLPEEKPVAQPERKAKPLISENIRRYKAIFREAYNFLERNSPPDQSEEYWEAACNDLMETGNKFPEDPLATEILVAIFAELEREYKRNK